MDDVFKALADPSRRALLDSLNERNGQSLRELSARLSMTRQSVSKHLAVLEAAELISTRRRGRDKLHFLDAEPIREVVEWAEEFRRFWDGGGRAEFSGKEPSCRDRESIFRSSKKRNWENPDIAQDDNHPVVCISWAEAAAYAQWLGKQTGKRYRLPAPAEFDRVASRAGRGDCTSANLADAAYNKQFESRDGSDCDDGFAATSPVERFAAIDGVFDIDGNVREWVAACGNGSAATTAGSCRDYSVKGRGWLSAAKESATFKDNYAADVSLNSVGFRVVRDLTN